MLAAALDEVDDLVTLDLLDNLGLNAGARHKGGADDGAVTAQHQDVIELNLFTCISSQFLDPEHIAGLNLVLLAAGLDDSEHRVFLFLTASPGPPRGVFAAGWPPLDGAPLRGRMTMKPGAKYPAGRGRL